MPCPDPDRVLDYLARRMLASEVVVLESHVDGCGACRELFATLARDSDGITIVTHEEPRTIGRYEIRERLGDGGMGTVYAAWDPQLARAVAIKVLHPEIDGRVAREGRALAKLSHPNVVAVYDADDHYIAMELVEGMTLAAWLDEVRPVDQILAAFLAVARGLAAAHRVGIVHRDVKPENVLVSRDGSVKVADFGLAVDDARAELAGTPSYMAPEVRRGEPATAASDQYSLAAALKSALPTVMPRAVGKAIARAMSDHRFASIELFARAIDPTRRLRRRIVVGAMVAVAVVATTTIVVARRPSAHARECAAIEAPMFVMPRDGAHFDRATHAYAEQLQSAGTQLCAASPPEQEFELATTCLRERRTAFDQLVTSSTPTVAQLHGLLPVDDCANPLPLAEERDARATPSGLVRRAVLAQELAAAPAARAVGDFRGATLHARTAIMLARPFGGALLAKALLSYGQVATPVDGFPPVDKAMREAVALSEAAHADRLRATALAYYMASLARQPGHEHEALTLQPIAEAAAQRANMQAELAPMLGVSVGIAQTATGDPEQGLATLERALAAARRLYPPDDWRLPEIIYPVGIVLGTLRRDAESIQYMTEAYTLASRAWGPDHPDAVRYQINLAARHASIFECDTAIGEAKHARTVLATVLAPASVELITLSRVIGFCLHKQQNWADELAEDLEREAVLRAAGRDHTTDIAETWTDLGAVELELERTDAAIAHYTRALALLEQIVGVSDVRLADSLGRLGEAELVANRPARAIPPLERALTLELAAHAPAIQLADVQFPLGKALWPSARGKQLVEQARIAFASGGQVFAPYLDRVVGWQHGH